MRDMMSSNLEQQRQHTLQQQKALRQKEEFRRKQQEKAARDAQKQSGRNYAPLTFQTNPPTSQGRPNGPQGARGPPPPRHQSSPVQTPNGTQRDRISPMKVMNGRAGGASQLNIVSGPDARKQEGFQGNFSAPRGPVPGPPRHISPARREPVMPTHRPQVGPHHQAESVRPQVARPPPPGPPFQDYSQVNKSGPMVISPPMSSPPPRQNASMPPMDQHLAPQVRGPPPRPVMPTAPPRANPPLPPQNGFPAHLPMPVTPNANIVNIRPPTPISQPRPPPRMDVPNLNPPPTSPSWRPSGTDYKAQYEQMLAKLRSREAQISDLQQKLRAAEEEAFAAGCTVVAIQTEAQANAQKEIDKIKIEMAFKDHEMKTADQLRAKAEQEAVSLKRKLAEGRGESRPGKKAKGEGSQMSTTSTNKETNDQPSEKPDAGVYGTDPADELSCRIRNLLLQFSPELCSLVKFDLRESRAEVEKAEEGEEDARNETFVSAQESIEETQDVDEDREGIQSLPRRLQQTLIEVSSGETDSKELLDRLAEFFPVWKEMKEDQLLALLSIFRYLFLSSKEHREHALHDPTIPQVSAPRPRGLSSRLTSGRTITAEEEEEAMRALFGPFVVAVKSPSKEDLLYTLSKPRTCSIVAEILDLLGNIVESSEPHRSLISESLSILIILAASAASRLPKVFTPLIRRTLIPLSEFTITKSDLLLQCELDSLLLLFLQSSDLFQELCSAGDGLWLPAFLHGQLAKYLEATMEPFSGPVVDVRQDVCMKSLQVWTNIIAWHGIDGVKPLLAYTSEDFKGIEILPGLIKLLFKEVRILVKWPTGTELGRDVEEKRERHIALIRQGFYVLLDLEHANDISMYHYASSTGTWRMIESVLFRLMNVLVVPELKDLSSDADTLYYDLKASEEEEKSAEAEEQRAEGRQEEKDDGRAGEEDAIEQETEDSLFMTA